MDWSVVSCSERALNIFKNVFFYVQHLCVKIEIQALLAISLDLKSSWFLDMLVFCIWIWPKSINFCFATAPLIWQTHHQKTIFLKCCICCLNAAVMCQLNHWKFTWWKCAIDVQRSKQLCNFVHNLVSIRLGRTSKDMSHHISSWPCKFGWNHRTFGSFPHCPQKFFYL